MKLFILLTNILWCIAVHGFTIVYIGFWWNTDILPNANSISGNLFQAIFAIIVFGLFAIDSYRKYFKGGQKLYFLMSSISPMVISLIGFVFGLYVVYLS
jgi:hypothetical protein